MRPIGFVHIDLCDSVVLGWAALNGQFDIRLELSLLKSHPEYVSPRAGERSCFTPGSLTFPSVRSVTGLLAQESVEAALDADGSPDYDVVHGLWFDGEQRYYIEGEFGEVRIVSDRPRIRISESGWSATAT